MIRKTALVAVVGLLVLGAPAALALGGAPHAAGTSSAVANQETTTEAGEQTTAAADANVTFLDQTSNGTTVVVDEVVLPDAGFVVIHAAAEADGPNATTAAEMGTDTATEARTTAADGSQYEAGEVLGNSSFLDTGTHLNVTVQLDQPIEESQVLIAMAHQDTNDNRVYEFPEADGPYVQDGEPVVDAAQVTVDGASNATATETETQTTTEA